MNPKVDRCRPRPPNTNSDPTNAKLRSLLTTSPRNWKILRPKPKFSTKMPKASCSPKPQSTVLSLMAFLAVEKTYARPRNTAIPSKPVSRPISSPCAFFRLNKNAGGLSPDDLTNQRRFERLLIPKNEAVFHQFSHFGELCLGIVTNCNQFFAEADPVSYALME